ncbi:MAG: LysM peptidoglycan-binding domain-containing protein, partial [Rhizobiales bacterium]|nr:LysM peptidoglycan-binding domain-containing protein [Hyphomicrobiales bacterium]
KPADDAASAAAPAGQGAAPAASAQGGQQMAAASAGETKTDAGQPAPAGAAAPAEGSAAVASAAGEQDVTAPKLKSVAGAVIIRRGDTLWRISRRVYGLGVRYTTIYLANQDQISDPDRIWPGQVFSVPDKTGDGEEADMSAVADRVVPVE